MGIRFHCPNGHKLNVKDFQAGQTGICPFCGVKTQIPLQSTRPSSKEAGQSSPFPTGADGADESGDSVTELDFLESSSRPVQADPHPSPLPEGDGKSAEWAEPTEGVASTPHTSSPNALPEEERTERDAGDVVWYVRPASGGQYGPAKTDLMRTWIAEGRVGADSLVWCEGWQNWREAGEVFPQLSAEGAIPGLDAIEVEPAIAPLFAHAGRHHSQPRRVPLILVGWLAAAFVILIVILSLILSHQYHS